MKEFGDAKRAVITQDTGDTNQPQTWGDQTQAMSGGKCEYKVLIAALVDADPPNLCWLFLCLKSSHFKNARWEEKATAQAGIRLWSLIWCALGSWDDWEDVLDSRPVSPPETLNEAWADGAISISKHKNVFNLLTDNVSLKITLCLHNRHVIWLNNGWKSVVFGGFFFTHFITDLLQNVLTLSSCCYSSGFHTGLADPYPSATFHEIPFSVTFDHRPAQEVTAAINTVKICSLSNQIV